MFMPSLFDDNFDLFDRFYQTPWFDGQDFNNLEKKLYGHRAKNVMSTDIKEKDDGYEMVIDLPGFTKDEVKVELNDGYLTVSAAKGLDEDDADSVKDAKAGKYIRRERYAGSVSRSFYVGEAITEEDIKAKFENGILRLTLPKKELNKIPETKRYIAIEG